MAYNIVQHTTSALYSLKGFLYYFNIIMLALYMLDTCTFLYTLNLQLYITIAVDVDWLAILDDQSLYDMASLKWRTFVVEFNPKEVTSEAL